MIPIIIGFAIVGFEIWFDHWLWDSELDDKPFSTIIRSLIFALYGCITLIIFNDVILAVLATSVTMAVFFVLFDFSLNVSRWDNLPLPYYQPFHSKVDKHMKEGWVLDQAKEMAYNDLTQWQRIVYNLKNFTYRFFWHGDERTKSWYDKIFQRIPPSGELLLKGSVLYVALHFYFNY